MRYISVHKDCYNNLETASTSMTEDFKPWCLLIIIQTPTFQMAFLFVRSYPELHNNFDSDVDSTTIVVETLKDTAKHLFSQVSSSTTRDNYVRKFQSDHTPVKRGLPCRMGRGYQGQVGRGRRYQGRRGCGCRYQGRIGIGWDQWTEAHL